MDTWSSRLSVVTLAMVSLCCVHAGPTRKWIQTSQKDFESGELGGVSVHSSGALRLAPNISVLLDKADAYVWSLVTDSKGNVYAATGDRGIVYKIADGKPSIFLDSSDPEVYALAVDQNDSVYAATSPSGIVYRVAPDGKTTQVFDSADPYVWAVAPGPEGTLLLGTGDKGRIVRVSKEGKSTVVYDSGDMHILCLAMDSKQNLYAGTDTNGLLYKISFTGSVSVAYDAAESEIRCVAVDLEDNVYFGTASGAALPRPPTTTTAPSTTSSSRPPTGAGVTTAGPPAPTKAPTAKPPPRQPQAPGKTVTGTNAVYRLDPEGNVTRIFAKKGVAMLSLACKDDSLLVGTGNDGVLYEISPSRTVTTLIDLDESQILAVTVGADERIVLGTGHRGKVVAMARDVHPKGTYKSTVFDSQFVSKWGRLDRTGIFPPKTKVAFATRSGNVKYPDDTWSDWSSPSDGPFVVTSPPSRFLQYRATLATTNPEANPSVMQVSVAYLSANQAPEVTDIGIVSPPRPSKKGPSASSGAPRPGSRADLSLPTRSISRKAEIAWTAADANRDRLCFDLLFRGEDEQTWKPLLEEEGQTKFIWDTESVPDGTYRVKVVASDAASQPPALAKTGEKVSDPFVIDNTPPSVKDIKVEPGVKPHPVKASILDNSGAVVEGYYAVDGDKWIPLQPADGIFDSKAEEIQLTIEVKQAGEHTLVIKVRDEAGNTGAGKVVFSVK